MGDVQECLKQPESAPVAVPAQIAVLLALSAQLFDNVALNRMAASEPAVRDAADIPGDACVRFESDEKPSDEDRKAVMKPPARYWCPSRRSQ